MDRTSPARQRRKATARSSAAVSAWSPWAARSAASSSRSEASLVFPEAAEPAMNCSATGPSAANAFSAGVFGRTARRGAGLGPP